MEKKHYGFNASTTNLKNINLH